MSEYTRDDALAFIESMRFTVASRAGFKWLSVRLGALASYVDEVSLENERLNAFLDHSALREAYEAFNTRDSLSRETRSEGVD